MSGGIGSPSIANYIWRFVVCMWNGDVTGVSRSIRSAGIMELERPSPRLMVANQERSRPVAVLPSWSASYSLSLSADV